MLKKFLKTLAYLLLFIQSAMTVIYLNEPNYIMAGFSLLAMFFWGNVSGFFEDTEKLKEYINSK